MKYKISVIYEDYDEKTIEAEDEHDAERQAVKWAKEMGFGWTVDEIEQEDEQ